MKRALLLILFCAAPSYATTLTIESGRVYMTQLTGLWTCAELGGVTGACKTAPLLMPPLDGTTTLSSWDRPLTTTTAALILNFIHSPINSVDEIVAVPFTMTGFWALNSGEEFELIGQGTLYCCTDQSSQFGPYLSVRFNFEPVATPEPQSALLVGLGLPMIVLLAMRLRRVTK